MSIRERTMRSIRQGTKHLRWLGLVSLGALIMILVSRWNIPLSVDSIFIDFYDHGVLLVERNGSAKLSTRNVRHGVFDVDDLFQQLLGALGNTWDEDKRADKRLATVRIFFNNHTSGTYFVYDRDYLDELFAFAQANVVNNP
ncbi:MAG: hypothetical protein ACM3QS_04200 [Bacteroidota bacterium]